MAIGLLIVLLLVLTLPFAVKTIEHNLEYFLFVMGLAAAIISGELSLELAEHIIGNYLLYLITAAVLVAGLVFKFFKEKIKIAVDTILKYLSLKLFIFLVIVILGLASSFITAIIASLILVEIIHVLPLSHKNKVKLNVTACFSIGLGAALTPIGEPLSTIVTSKLNGDFWLLAREIGVFVFFGIIGLGLAGVCFIHTILQKPQEGETKNQLEKPMKKANVSQPDSVGEAMISSIEDDELRQDIEEDEKIREDIALETDIEVEALENDPVEQAIFIEEASEIDHDETFKHVIIRAVKVFIFILALELLGAGFKPLIDEYVLGLPGQLLYWINTFSAILDNATLAAAEISSKMSEKQIRAVLMGLLISGGMLIPGNIPNIISAGKLKIKSSEWARIGLPMGFAILLLYFFVVFYI